MRPVGLLVKYDGITKAGIESEEERLFLFNRDAGKCQTCGARLSFSAFQIAHKIANTEANKKRWGKAVVNHTDNKACTCPNAYCNSRQNIGGKPIACFDLYSKIIKEIGNENN